MIWARVTVLSLTLLAIASIGGYAVMQSVQRPTATTETVCEPFANSPKRRILPMGARMPLFELRSVQGPSVHLGHALTQGRARLALIELFATWCPHCKASVPTLRELQQAYGDHTLVLAVNAGDPPEGPFTGTLFRDQYAVTYPILEAPSGELLKQLCVSSFPTFYLVDASGTIRWRHIGELTPDVRKTLESAITTHATTP